MKKKGLTTIEILLLIVAVIILGSICHDRTKDVRYAKKGAEVQSSLAEIRIAMERYYIAVGEYPKLTTSEIEDNLKELKTTSKNGAPVNFGEILGKNVFPSTPKIEWILKNNELHDVQEFSGGIKTGVYGTGGWNYDESGGTGEIHADMPKNIFNQGIDWSRQ